VGRFSGSGVKADTGLATDKKAAEIAMVNTDVLNLEIVTIKLLTRLRHSVIAVTTPSSAFIVRNSISGLCYPIAQGVSGLR
jgi:hypothetical protein